MCCNWRTTNWIASKRLIHWNVHLLYGNIECLTLTLIVLSLLAYLPRRNGWEVGESDPGKKQHRNASLHHHFATMGREKQHVLKEKPSDQHPASVMGRRQHHSTTKSRATRLAIHQEENREQPSGCSVAQKMCWIWFWYMVWCTYGGVFFAIRFKDLIRNTVASSQSTAINIWLVELQTLPTVLTDPGKQRFGRNLPGFNAAELQR